MRRGDNPCGITDGKRIVALSFGSDFCTEHETGISSLRESFGIPGMQRGVVGADARTITRIPNELLFHWDESTACAYLVFHPDRTFEGETGNLATRFDSMIDVYPDELMSAAWDERSFGFHVKDTDSLNAGQMALGQVFDAFMKKDIMIFTGSRGESSFSNPGLMIAIRSRMDQGVLQKMKDADEDRLNLLDAADKIYQETGLKDKLEAVGKKYFALSPRWRPNDWKKGTTHPVIFWLNPQKQRVDNCGWFTVEDLLLWTENKGPIPIIKNRVSA